MTISVTPQGNIYLCKTPLESDYKHQLTFADKQAQTTYFTGTVFKTYSNYTYIKKDNVVKVNENIDAIRQCNYLFYVNTGFSSRVFYCFIDKMEYVNENCTAITFSTDCFQTWYFDLEYKPCFIERETVLDDTVGAHTIPENIETGEYVVNSSSTVEEVANYYRNDDMFIILQVSDVPSFVSETPRFYYNNLNGCYLLGVPASGSPQAIARAYDADSKADAIVSVFMAPKAVFDPNFPYVEHTWTYTDKNGNQKSTGVWYMQGGERALHSYSNMGSKTLTKPDAINGYVPRNKKLLTFPFQYLNISNNAGTDQVYHYEDFSQMDFSVQGAVTPGLSIKLVPLHYKNVDGATSNAYDFAITGAKYPICSWVSDAYTNWLTQNCANLIASPIETAAASFVGTGGGIQGAIAGTVSGASAIANSIIKNYKASLTPDQAKGNTNSGDVNYSAGHMGFTFYPMAIKQEYAKVADQYFSMYGYKVNTVKVPSLTGRRYWNYVKTIDANVEGDIPQEDLEIVRQMFDNGVTLWHDATNMYNFNLNNTIL